MRKRLRAGETAMATSKSHIESLIADIQQREQLDVAAIELSRRAELSALRRDLDKRVEPVLVDAGINTKTIRDLLVDHQKKVREHWSHQNAAAEKYFAALDEQHRAGRDNRRNALEHISGLPQIVTPIVIPTPFSIYAAPSGMLVDSNAIDHGSWGRIHLTDSHNTASKAASLRFYFSWRNESAYAAVITASADLTVRGICQAQAESNLFTGGNASLTVYARLITYMGGGSFWGPPADITSVKADSRGALFFGSPDFDQKYVYTVPTVAKSEMIIEADQLVIFEVALWAQYSIDAGSILLDFSGPERFVMCSGLVIGLLSSPTLTAVSPTSPTIAGPPR
jgi:hypothetical protein